MTKKSNHTPEEEIREAYERIKQAVIDSYGDIEDLSRKEYLNKFREKSNSWDIKIPKEFYNYVNSDKVAYDIQRTPKDIPDYEKEYLGKTNVVLKDDSNNIIRHKEYTVRGAKMLRTKYEKKGLKNLNEYQRRNYMYILEVLKEK